MKKILSLLLCLALLLGTAATAETTLNGGEARNIQINKADLNDEIDGVSPITGRDLNQVFEEGYQDGFSGQAVTGVYLPIIVQIDNADGGIGYSDNGKANGNRAPWGAQYTDVIYETPLYKQGDTRLSFVFSDLIPDAVGPIRSARMFHAWLREEWDCCFAYYGQQLYTATNVAEVFNQTGATSKADGLLLFSGIVGDNKPWKQYYTKFPENKKKLAPPHDKSANAAAMVSLTLSTGFQAPNHAFKFADALPEGGDDAEEIYIEWAKGGLAYYNSLLEWDEDNEWYDRFMSDKSGKFSESGRYSTLKAGPDEAVPIHFNNIIVQFTDIEWPRTDAPKPTVLGTGNADYFMGGKHFTGVWNRDSLSERTVFYDENGEEIELQRGRTLVVVMDYQTEGRSIRYE